MFVVAPLFMCVLIVACLCFVCGLFAFCLCVCLFLLAFCSCFFYFSRFDVSCSVCVSFVFVCVQFGVLHVLCLRFVYGLFVLCVCS